MKPFLIAAAILLIALSGAQFVPGAAPYSFQIAIASLIVAAAVLIASLSGGRRAEPVAKPAAAEAVKPAAAAAPQNQAQAVAVTLLGVFQEKGRLVDFLMEDIAAFDDAQVGAVVRAVHQGCRSALQEHFGIEPMVSQPEGSEITVPAGYAADEFRLVGKLGGAAPFKGRLVHKGWKATSVKLPRVLNADANRLPAIAPAQIELQ